MREKMHRRMRILLAGSALCLLLPRVDGALSYWRGDEYHDGVYDYFQSEYWSTGTPPGEGDGARFEGGTGVNKIPLDAGFTVQLTEDLTTESWIWNGTAFTMTLDLNGYALTNTTATFNIDGEGVAVNMTGGFAQLHYFSPGRTAGSTGSLHLAGADMHVFLPSAGSSSSVGASGNGTLRITDGARLEGGGRMFYVASGATSTGFLEAARGSTFTNRNHIVVGDYGSAHVLIESNSQVVVASTGHNIIFGQRGDENQVATALITGEGALLRNEGTSSDRGIILGGSESGHVKTDGTVAVTVADRGRMEANKRILVWDGHALAIDNGTVSAGADFVLKDDVTLTLTLYTADRDALVQVGENVELGNVQLVLEEGSGSSFSIGQFVKLIGYAGTLSDGDGGDGRFSNYAQDQTFFLGDDEFRFDYAYQPEPGGDRFVGLHVIPEPGVLALLALALLLPGIRRKAS